MPSLRVVMKAHFLSEHGGEDGQTQALGHSLPQDRKAAVRHDGTNQIGTTNDQEHDAWKRDQKGPNTFRVWI